MELTTPLQLVDVPWRNRGRVARQIVVALSVEELRRIPPESRHCLREALSLGNAPRKDKESLNKILTAELLDNIPAKNLVMVEYQQGTIIKGSGDFVGKVRSQLDRIILLSIGRRLLQSLAQSGMTVTIVPSSRKSEARPDNYRAAIARGKVLKWRDESGKERAIRGTGAGSDTTIRFNSDQTIIGTAEAWQQQPPEIWLGHELIHADDFAYGRMDPVQKDGIRNYERQAIGLPPFDQKEFTENKLRAEWSEPQPARPRY
ncbi:MAG: type III secretion system effector protein [Acidobacteria bacterium]|nr:type III secretion system effector protein [Acidobacteriota bacterium]MCI0664834.1 type III secretion system effector protein [Acidobacteriota bacterium]